MFFRLVCLNTVCKDNYFLQKNKISIIYHNINIGAHMHEQWHDGYIWLGVADLGVIGNAEPTSRRIPKENKWHHIQLIGFRY